MVIRIAERRVLYRIKRWRLEAKWRKALAFLEHDLKHPALNLELMEPRHCGIYSFRLDKKYRALFFFDENGDIEIFQITNHYRK